MKFSYSDIPMILVTVIFAVLYIVYVKYRDKLVEKSIDKENAEKDKNL